jgi:gamma-glutamyltranspeptidase/glutathione hydrolase
MVIRLSDSRTDVIDYREKAPLSASRDMFLNEYGDVVEGMSTESHLASGVPGTVDGIMYAHTKYGKLPFKDVIQPAIDLAEKGFHLTSGQVEDFNSNRQNFIDRNLSRPAFVKDSLWKEGDIFIQKDLASTLKRIRDLGRNGFYSGTTARLIIKEMNRGNGIISQKDLNDYKSTSRVPLSTDYKGYKILTVPPPSGGGILLIQLLEMIEPFPLEEWGFHSYKTIHLMTEVEKRAFADRSEYSGDPDYMTIKPDQLIDKDYLIDRMSSFNENKASDSREIQPGALNSYSSEETTHYSVIDSEGNAVSATTTLNGSFGNCVVVDSAGFLLNNQMDDFSVKPGIPNMYGLAGGETNSVQPGKRMLSSMTPSIIEKNGKLFLTVGSPGGSTIPTTVFQIIVNVIDFKMNIRDAVDKGRFHHQWLPDYISYEKNAIDSVTLHKLQSIGHSLKERTSLGRINAIMLTPEGKKAGGADKRGNNSSLGY